LVPSTARRLQAAEPQQRRAGTHRVAPVNSQLADVLAGSRRVSVLALLGVAKGDCEVLDEGQLVRGRFLAAPLVPACGDLVRRGVAALGYATGHLVAVHRGRNSGASFSRPLHCALSAASPPGSTCVGLQPSAASEALTTRSTSRSKS